MEKEKKEKIRKRAPRRIAYVRVSTDQQDVNKQRLEILDYAHRNEMKIHEFITIEISSRKTEKERRIEELMSKLDTGDTLIISELSRLGRSIHEVIGLVNNLVKRDIRLIALKQNIDLKGKHDTTSKVMVTVFSLMAELERDLTSQRTKAALKALKSTGVKLGRPKGKLGKSKLDGRQEEIRILMEKKVSKSAIARLMGVSREGFLKFMKSRKVMSRKNTNPATTTLDEILANYAADRDDVK